MDVPPGLRVRREAEAGPQRRFWVVVHAESDLRVGPPWPRKREAEVHALRMASLANWAQPADVLTTCRSLKDDVERVSFG